MPSAYVRPYAAAAEERGTRPSMRLSACTSSGRSTEQRRPGAQLPVGGALLASGIFAVVPSGVVSAASFNPSLLIRAATT